MATGKADLISAVAAVVMVIGLCVGIYGKYSSDMATHTNQIVHLEKELEVFSQSSRLAEDERDVLWVDTQKNSEIIKVLRKDQEKFDTAFIKFADAVDRLSVSVARLEERMGKG